MVSGTQQPDNLLAVIRVSGKATWTPDAPARSTGRSRTQQPPANQASGQSTQRQALEDPMRGPLTGPGKIRLPGKLTLERDASVTVIWPDAELQTFKSDKPTHSIKPRSVSRSTPFDRTLNALAESIFQTFKGAKQSIQNAAARGTERGPFMMLVPDGEILGEQVTFVWVKAEDLILLVRSANGPDENLLNTDVSGLTSFSWKPREGVIKAGRRYSWTLVPKGIDPKTNGWIDFSIASESVLNEYRKFSESLSKRPNKQQDLFLRMCWLTERAQASDVLWNLTSVKEPSPELVTLEQLAWAYINVVKFAEDPLPARSLFGASR